MSSPPDSGTAGVFDGALFIGSKQIGFTALQSLNEALPDEVVGVVTFDDSGDPRSAFHEMRTYALNHGIPLHVLQDKSQLPTLLSEVRPRCAFVVGWYWILPDAAIKGVPNGVVGIHASLLPDLRGSAPLVWAILTEREETGVTLFYLDSGIDSGDIIGQSRFAIRTGDTITALMARSAEATSSLISKHAASVLLGQAERHPQRDEDATYGGIRRPLDGRVDWSSPNDMLIRFVRAQTRPYPGAYTTLGDSTIRIWSAIEFPRPLYGVPGVVVQLADEGPVVATGNGAVVLEDFTVESPDDAQLLNVGRRLGSW